MAVDDEFDSAMAIVLNRELFKSHFVAGHLAACVAEAWAAMRSGKQEQVDHSLFNIKSLIMSAAIASVAQEN